jgi:peptidoglycan/LPS O-acetylase OafA/YrhL
VATGFVETLRARFRRKKQASPLPLRVAPAPTEKGKPRFVELDALRGLAACIVVINHFRGAPTVEPSWVSYFFAYPPTSFLASAAQGVVLFFLLSGFVLALPYIDQPGPRYQVFVVRRIFRIYVPYVIALGFAVWGASCFHGAKGSNYGSWFADQWSEPVDPRLVVQHLLFLGNYNTMEFNSPIWSLVEEMRISLLFPLFCPLVLRLPAIGAVALVPVLSLIEHFLHIFHLMPGRVHTVHHIGMFVLGIVLAKHRNELRRFINGPSVFRYVAVVLLSFACLQLSQECSYVDGPYAFVDWAADIAAGGFIILSLGENHIARFLRQVIPQFLGHISYSIYLLHIPLLLLLFYIFRGIIPYGWLFVPFAVLTLLLSSLFYRLVELPAMQAGRHLAQRLR